MGATEAMSLRKHHDQEPYVHDCKSCKWVGWLSNFMPGKNNMGNVYLCVGTTPPSVLIRFGDEPGAYWSMSVSDMTPSSVRIHS